MKRRGLLSSFLIFITIGIFLTFAFASADNSTNTTSASLTASNNYTLTTGSGTSFVNVPSDQQGAINNAYQCLNNQIANKSSSDLSLQEAVFGMMAVGSKDNLQQEIDNDESTSSSCWPKQGCTVKDTAQVLLAYERSGQSRSDIENWLTSRNSTSTDLNWFLEMDISNNNASQCTLTYDGSQKTVNIGNDMKLSGNPGSCFTFSSSGYWLLFRNNCYNKDIKISCDKDFITTLLYQKVAGTTTYVLPTTHSAASLGSTDETVNTQCFKTGNTCDYEGSLWAAFALQKDGINVDPLIPYLIAMSDNNAQYFPGAFLYSFTGADDQYSNIVQSQQQGRFWKMINTPYNQFYDSALAMLALSQSSATELDNSKNYFLSIQGSDGCWNNGNIRDTAFLLYAGWPRAVAGAGGGSGTGGSLCQAVSGQSCQNTVSCINAGGRVLSNFQCPGFSVCCSVNVQQQSCAAQNGAICGSNQQCSGNSLPSSDSGTCCLGTCVNQQLTDTCSPAGGVCKNICSGTDDTDSTKTCTNTGNVCCIAQATPSGGSSWWIILLTILIIILVALILLRNKIKVWWFKYKGKAKVSPIVRPGVPPVGQGYRPQPGFRPQPSFNRPSAPQRMPARKQPLSEKDREMEETLKKLREMSK